MPLPRRLGAATLAALTAFCLLAVPGETDARAAGTLTTGSAPSPALDGERIAYTAYLPYGYDRGAARHPVLYLLHGRGDTMQAWTRVKTVLDDMIRTKRIPPVIAVMPDAPWSERGNWYADSRYTGADLPGRPVETALTRDLVAHVDATYRTAPIREARLVGGYSMGGAGALRFALAHQDVFSAAAVLSPAVYTPLPPSDSSTRDYGAFGRGEEKFSDEVYRELAYPALLPGLNPDLPVRLFVAVGDDEYANPDPADARHDLDFESAALYNAARRSPALSAQLRVMDGGHDWSVWTPAFEQAMAELGPGLSVTPPTGLPAPLHGTAATDRAGGVAAHPDGALTIGYAAGQPSTGRLDAVVTRIGGWTRQFGSPADERLYGVAPLPDGGVLTAGYTKGDLDGRHPGNAADDAFVARLGPDGTVRWITQFGAPDAADRLYGLAAAPDGGAYVAGYTRGSLDGPNNGDKDAIVARLTPAGELSWIRQYGGTGEDKAYGVAADATTLYVAGSATAALPGTSALGGLDGWLAAFAAADGSRAWATTAGGSGDDRLNAVTVTTAGLAVATGASGGDAYTVAHTEQGRRRWEHTLATPAADEGAAVTALPGGEVEVVGYTRGRIGVPAGGADVLTARLDGRGTQRAAAQLGTARDDAVDPFAEPNLYAATTSTGRVAISGLTYGAPAGGAALGNGDVFLIS
ncbi:S-formylglutathione hydrolase FrmB [Nonomuraea polychroma]|uniref:S-formylglutathione hydrolase FrmB n=1 Tax=Nonomuraea polychroma TaxID=46176 RepID=A0A438MA11_9ACTN|nr:alpha/beta hydrolase-fold protein [Nonomuraea polychroma]RVX42561.1 S-formylglutathione hydrolase FrmB [Nonomuraea polychroma]